MTVLRDIGDAWSAAYADLMRMAREMWPVLLMLCGLYLITAMAWFALPMLVNTLTGKMVMRYLVLVGSAFIAAPYFIALHRFVAFGETQWFPTHEAYGAATATYTAWAAVTQLLCFAPLLFFALLSRLGLSPEMAGLPVLAMLIIAWWLLVRLTTLLPMAALDPQRANWQQALDHSRGRFWFIFAATTTVASPAYLTLMILGRAAATRSIGELPFFALSLASLLALQLLPLSIGTRFYKRVRTVG